MLPSSENRARVLWLLLPSLVVTGIGVASASVSTPLSSKIVVAINAGGPSHRDIFGIKYALDPSNEGSTSDYGRRYDIQRVHPGDQILYQTERYTTSLGMTYRLPLKGDGDYVLVLKFCEVYFRSSGAKVFDVLLNGVKVVADLDIFANVGPTTAHDEYVQFRVTDGGTKLVVMGTKVELKDGKLTLRFERGAADNPKINAFYLMKGRIEEVPKLPEPLAPTEDDEPLFDEDEDYESVAINDNDLGYDSSKNIKTFSTGYGDKVRSGSKVQDPWEDSTMTENYLPVIVAILSSAFTLIALLSFMKFP